MEYRKAVKDGYILGVAKVSDGGNISEEEYTELSEMIHNQPIAPDGYYYRLTTGLEWELCEIPTVSPETEELSDSEALAIIVGGNV